MDKNTTIQAVKELLSTLCNGAVAPENLVMGASRSLAPPPPATRVFIAHSIVALCSSRATLSSQEVDKRPEAPVV